MVKKKATKKTPRSKKRGVRPRLDSQNPDAIELVGGPVELKPGAEKVMQDLFVRIVAKALHDRLGGRVLSKKEMKIVEDELERQLPDLKAAFWENLKYCGRDYKTTNASKKGDKAED